MLSGGAGTPGGDHGEGQDQFGDVSGVVHQFPGLAQLSGRGRDLDEQAGVEQLGDDGVRGDRHSQNDEPGRDRGPSRRGVGPCDDPGKEVSGEKEVPMDEPVQPGILRRGGVERGEVQDREAADVQDERSYGVGEDVQGPGAQHPADRFTGPAGQGAQQQNPSAEADERAWRNVSCGRPESRSLTG